MKKHYSLFTIHLLIFGFGLVLGGCGNGIETTPLPAGEQEITGVLEPTELSFKRRGTHKLFMDGVEVYYAESQRVNLRSFEGVLATLKGRLEQNIDSKDMPVLVVSEIVKSETNDKEWVLRSFGISFSTPKEWTKDGSTSDVQFFIPENPKPIITVFRQEEEPPSGHKIKIDGKEATRVQDSRSGAESIYIKLKEEYVVILFSPDKGDILTLRSRWLSILRSIRVSSSGKDSDIPITGTGGTIPCGGVAGILCPPGYFCNITDLNENIGHCERI